MRTVPGLVALLALGALSGCTDYTAESAARGGLVGGTLGFMVGAVYGHPLENAARGAVVGVVAGAVQGSLAEIEDRRRRTGDGYREGYREPAYDDRYAGGYGYAEPGYGGARHPDNRYRTDRYRDDYARPYPYQPAGSPYPYAPYRTGY